MKFNSDHLKIVSVSTNQEVIEFADWMSGSSPWRELGLSKDYFLNDLRLPVVENYVLRHTSLGPLGYLCVLPYGLALEPLVEYMVIRDDCRRSGLGKMMIKYFEDQRFPGAHNLYLFVSDFNLDGRHFYASLGYKQVGELEDLDVRGHSEILMRKSRGPKLGEPAE